MNYFYIIYLRHPLYCEVHDERVAGVIFIVAALDALCQGNRKVAGSAPEFIHCLCSSRMGVDRRCGANAVRNLASEPFDPGIHDVFRLDLFHRLFHDLDDRRFCYQAIQKTAGSRCEHARVTVVNLRRPVRFNVFFRQRVS